MLSSLVNQMLISTFPKNLISCDPRLATQRHSLSSTHPEGQNNGFWKTQVRFGHNLTRRQTHKFIPRIPEKVDNRIRE